MSVKLNKAAVDWAKNKIQEGKLNEGTWDAAKARQSVPDEEIKEYCSNRFLGTESDSDGTKKTDWSYPIAIDENVYPTAIRAVISAASGGRGVEEVPEIAEAGRELLDLINKFKEEKQVVYKEWGYLNIKGSEFKTKTISHGGYPIFIKDVVKLDNETEQMGNMFLTAYNNFNKYDKLGFEVVITYPESEWTSTHPVNQEGEISGALKTRGRVGKVISMELINDSKEQPIIIAASVEIYNKEVADKMESGEIGYWSLCIVLDGSIELQNGIVKAPFFEHLALTSEPYDTQQTNHFVRIASTKNANDKNLMKGVEKIFIQTIDLWTKFRDNVFGKPKIEIIEADIQEQKPEKPEEGEEDMSEIKELKEKLDSLQNENKELQEENKDNEKLIIKAHEKELGIQVEKWVKEGRIPSAKSKDALVILKGIESVKATELIKYSQETDKPMPLIDALIELVNSIPIYKDVDKTNIKEASQPQNKKLTDTQLREWYDNHPEIEQYGISYDRFLENKELFEAMLKTQE